MYCGGLLWGEQNTSTCPIYLLCILPYAKSQIFLSSQVGTILVYITHKILIFLKMTSLEMFLRILYYISMASLEVVSLKTSDPAVSAKL